MNEDELMALDEVAGPWMTESDREEFDHAGLKCLILRHAKMRHLCGYVGLTEKHPWFRKSSEQCLLGCAGEEQEGIGKRKWMSWDCRFEHDHPTPGSLLRVHGGLTFAAMGGDRYGGDAYPKGFWWFGFDMAHCDDLSPGMENVLRHVSVGHETTGTYRDIEYVRGEVKSLAEQLKKYGKTGWFWSRYWPVYWYLCAVEERWHWKLWRFRRDVDKLIPRLEAAESWSEFWRWLFWLKEVE